MNKFYRLISVIPFTTFKKDDVFMVDEHNNMFVNGIMLNTCIEKMLNLKDSKHFREIFFKFKVGDTIRYKFRPREGEKVYKIINIDPKYIVLREFFSNVIETVPNSSRYTDNMIRTEEYWFISSCGKVQCAFTGKDAKADEYRESVGNFFSSKDEAKNWVLIAIKNNIQTTMERKDERMTIGEIIDNLLSVIVGKLRIAVIEDDMRYIIGRMVENKINVLYYYINFETGETNVTSKFSENEFLDCDSCYRIDVKYGDIETIRGVELAK